MNKIQATAVAVPLPGVKSALARAQKAINKELIQGQGQKKKEAPVKMKVKKVLSEAERKAKLDAQKKNLCVCGCGTKVKGTFAQGHDQRVRGWIQRGELNPSVRAAIKRGLLVSMVKTANQPIIEAA